MGLKTTTATIKRLLPRTDLSGLATTAQAGGKLSQDPNSGAILIGVNTLDDRYYTESETDAALAGKANTATTLSGYGITDAISSSGGTIAASSATATPLKVKGAASQTANLVEVQDSSSSVLVRLSPRITSANATLVEVNPAKQLVQGTVVQMFGYNSSYFDLTQSHDPGLNASLNAPFIRMRGRNNSAGVLTYVTGQLGVVVTGPEKARLDFMVEGSAGFYVYKHENRTPVCGVNSLLTEAQLNVEPNWTGKKGVVVRAIAGQAASLFEVQSSAGSVEWGIAPGGHVTFTGLLSLGPYTFATLPSASANAGKCLRITDRGQKHAYSDGTNWLFVHDNSVVI